VEPDTRTTVALEESIGVDEEIEDVKLMVALAIVDIPFEYI
jgi:hypothetical protein